MLHEHRHLFRMRWLMPGLIAACAAGVGCSHHIAVDPIEVKPIYLTVDVNVRLDEELRESFGFEDRIERQVETTQPSTAPAEPVAQPVQSGGTSS